jgi:hypothetical protein
VVGAIQDLNVGRDEEKTNAKSTSWRQWDEEQVSRYVFFKPAGTLTAMGGGGLGLVLQSSLGQEENKAEAWEKDDMLELDLDEEEAKILSKCMAITIFYSRKSYNPQYHPNCCWITYHQRFITRTASKKCSNYQQWFVTTIVVDKIFINNDSQLEPLLIIANNINNSSSLELLLIKLIISGSKLELLLII